MKPVFSTVHHAVVPAAGRGTRFLPLTKAVPKEMLPLLARPTIDYVVQEATDAGIEDVLLISRSGKESVVDYFDTDPELEQYLQQAGNQAALAAINTYADQARVFAVRQGNPRGLGHAVLQARSHVGDNPFAVLLPDDILWPGDPLLKQMCRVREQCGGSVVALMKVTPEQAVNYGSAAVETVTDLPFAELGLPAGTVFKITDIVEKPPLEAVLSEYAVAGRYVLDPVVFDILETLSPGRGGEIQLTDALQELIRKPADQGGGLYGVVLQGERFDTGTPAGYLQAYISFALRDPNLGPAVRDFLRGLSL